MNGMNAMKTTLRILGAAIAVSLFLFRPGLSSQGQAEEPRKGNSTVMVLRTAQKGAPHKGSERTRSETSARTVAATTVPRFVPPVDTAPAPGSRKGLGTRGPGGTVPELVVLAPEHTGLTVQEQPVLYWYISSLDTPPIEFNLILKTGVTSVVEKRLAPPTESGLQRVRLADYGVRLTANQVYNWHISLVPDPEARSQDIVASGAIQRIVPAQGLSARLARAQGIEAAHIYAEEGLWYDVLSTISELIDADPTNQDLRKQRAALLEQVRLAEVAAYDTSNLATEGG